MVYNAAPVVGGEEVDGCMGVDGGIVDLTDSADVISELCDVVAGGWIVVIWGAGMMVVDPPPVVETSSVVAWIASVVTTALVVVRSKGAAVVFNRMSYKNLKTTKPRLLVQSQHATK